MLLLLDTPSLYFRAFHGVPESVTAPDGTPSNAIRGLLDAVTRLVEAHHPTRLVATMDADWRPTWRTDLIAGYKAHRVGEDGGDQTPAGLEAQLPAIHAVLAALGIAELAAAGYEADDVIGTLASRAAEAGTPVLVSTGDRDLFQLVRDDVPVHIWYPMRGRGPVRVDEAEVSRRYAIPGRSYAAFATLRGDPSDGLPGVAGVGEKTAAALVSRFGDVEAVLTAARTGSDTGFPPGSRRKVLDAQDYLERAARVVAVATDVPVPDGFDDALPTTVADPAALTGLSQRWGLDSTLNRLLAAFTAG